jgi:ABC-type transporter Mla subunit MlaD
MIDSNILAILDRNGLDASDATATIVLDIAAASALEAFRKENASKLLAGRQVVTAAERMFMLTNSIAAETGNPALKKNANAMVAVAESLNPVLDALDETIEVFSAGIDDALQAGFDKYAGTTANAQRRIEAAFDDIFDASEKGFDKGIMQRFADMVQPARKRDEQPTAATNTEPKVACDCPVCSPSTADTSEDAAIEAFIREVFGANVKAVRIA